MFSILKKELIGFFASAIGYMVMALFLLANGLLLWVFKSDYNIFDAGFADLNSFFYISPWLFFFLIPAITMRSFVDEKTQGTFELLKTKPITNWQLVLGKYFGAFLLIVFALIPSLIYVYSVNTLANPQGNIDLGPIIGAYIGLLFIASSYTAIGLLASALSKNQIVAFLIAVLLCFIMFYGFEALANLEAFKNLNLEYFGMKYHYNSLARGVLDTRDLGYFFSLSILFLAITHKIVEKQ
jgi:ABC-2 type transport system permease protein